MRSRLLSLAVLGALVLSACGGSSSTTTRLRNSATNCFESAEAQTLAVDTARSNLITAQSALKAAGDKAALDAALAAATTEVATLQSQFNAAESAHNAAAATKWDLYAQGYRIDMPAGPDLDLYKRAWNAEAKAFAAKDALILPLNRARQRQSQAQTAVNNWTSAESTVSQGQTALTAAESTPLCATNDIVAADDTTEDTTATDDTAAPDDTTATEDTTATDDTTATEDTTATDDTRATDDTVVTQDTADTTDSTSEQSSSSGEVQSDGESAPDAGCLVIDTEVDGTVEVGQIFDFIVVTNALCGSDVWVRTSSNLGSTASVEWGAVTVAGPSVAFSFRAIAVANLFIKAGTVTNDSVWIQNQVSIVAAGELAPTSGLCEGVTPLVSWSDDDNGTLTVTGNCAEAVRVDLEVFNEVGDILFWSQTILNNGTTGYSVGDVRTLLLKNQQVGYRAWHMCAPVDSQSTSDWFLCGDAVESIFAGESSTTESSTPSTTVAPSEEVGPQPVPIGLLTPVATTSDGGAVPETPVAQVVIDPSVVILVCEQECVDKVADRTGIEEGFVEMRIDDGEWGPALGGIIPVGDGAVSVEFRTTPVEGDAVVLAADFKGAGKSIREVSTVKPSGEVVDSNGEVISTVPVYETVESNGQSLINIALGVVAALVLLTLAVITMMKRKQKLTQGIDDSSTKA